MTNPLSNLSRYPRRPFKEKPISKINDRLFNTPGIQNEYSVNDFDSSILDDELNNLLEDVSTDIATKNMSRCLCMNLI